MNSIEFIEFINVLWFGGILAFGKQHTFSHLQVEEVTNSENLTNFFLADAKVRILLHVLNKEKKQIFLPKVKIKQQRCVFNNFVIFYFILFFYSSSAFSKTHHLC